MDTYEKLGMFYLGKRYDLEHRARTSDLVLYDSKDPAVEPWDGNRSIRD